MAQQRRTRKEDTHAIDEELGSRPKWSTTATQDLGGAISARPPTDHGGDSARAEHREAIRPETDRVVEQREERAAPHKELRDAVVIHTEREEVPSRLEVESYREEVEIERIPIDKAVTERKAAWYEGETLVVPVYEERIVAVKRLILTEHVKIRRVGHRETHLFEQTVQRDRLVVEDSSDTGKVRERYATEEYKPDGTPRSESPSIMEQIGKKLLG